VGGEDPFDRGGAVRCRQRQSLTAVYLDGQYEGVLVHAVEVADVDGVVAAERRGPQPVHAVDDAHRRTLDDDRRQHTT
jgi:hypothetical protein